MSFKIPFEILLLTSSAGGLQSAFFGVYLFTVRKGNRLANKVLALLLLAFSIRIAKSVSYYFTEGHSIPQLFENIGYAAHVAIAPLFWIYLNTFLKKDYRFAWLKDGIHLLPSILILLLSPFLNSHFWLKQNGYTFSLIFMGAYLPFCILFLYKNFSSINKTQKNWLLSITTGVSLVWAAYFSNYLLGIVSYITAPVIFSFVMYYMSYLGLKQNNVLLQEIKYKNSVFSIEEIEQCFAKLQQLMVRENLYRDTMLTLPKLAKHMLISSNLLSQAINEKAKQNFPDFINSYRINEAKKILSSPDSANQKISSIAFDTGFNTLSAFNNAFKKFTSITPSEYRKSSVAS